MAFRVIFLRLLPFAVCTVRLCTQETRGNTGPPQRSRTDAHFWAVQSAERTWGQCGPQRSQTGNAEGRRSTDVFCPVSAAEKGSSSLKRQGRKRQRWRPQSRCRKQETKSRPMGIETRRNVKKCSEMAENREGNRRPEPRRLFPGLPRLPCARPEPVAGRHSSLARLGVGHTEGEAPSCRWQMGTAGAHAARRQWALVREQV